MKKVIESNLAPKAIGPYSQGIEVNNLIFVSGQLPIDAETNQMPETIEKQTEQSLLNIKHILEQANSSMDKIVKTTVLLQNMDDFSKMNEVYASFFEKECPARVCYEVVKLPKNALVEIDCIAYK